MSTSENNLEELLSEAILITDTVNQPIIEIKGDDEIITLKGTVESEQDKSGAETLARKQEGLTDVINKLHIWGL